MGCAGFGAVGADLGGGAGIGPDDDHADALDEPVEEGGDVSKKDNRPPPSLSSSSLPRACKGLRCGMGEPSSLADVGYELSWVKSANEKGNTVLELIL